MDATTSAIESPRGSVRARRENADNADIISSDNKRAKTSGAGPNIDNIPDSVLLDIASFLPDRISRALLAVALTAPSSSWRKAAWKIQPSPSAAVILSANNANFYGSVDFADAGKELAARLSDEDVGAILACASAMLPLLRTGDGETHTIKVVKLTHCYSMRGDGLETLRTSTDLEQLDLSLVGKREDGMAYPETCISEDVVVPILQSIVDSDGCSLTNIQFPKKWRTEQSESLRQFLSSFGDVMNSRRITCCGEQCVRSSDGVGIEYVQCGASCQGTTGRPWFSQSGDDFGTPNFMCASCTASFCHECADEVNNMCEKCDKKQCLECSQTLKCHYCKETTCRDCTMIGECYSCERASCGECDPVFFCDCGEARCTSCVPHLFCDYEGCTEGNCGDCGDRYPRDIRTVRQCFDCGEDCYCPGHLLLMHVKDGADAFCDDCNERATSLFVQYNNEFEKWVLSLETKYGCGISCSHLNGVDDFSGALQNRDRLRQRCNAVGSKLSLKQKQFERFDHWLERYEQLLNLENTLAGYGRFGRFSYGG